MTPGSAVSVSSYLVKGRKIVFTTVTKPDTVNNMKEQCKTAGIAI